MGTDVARDAQWVISMGNTVARDIHYETTMNNDVDVCTYHGITMHNDIAMNIFSVLCLIVLFYYGLYGIKTRTSSCLISLGWRTYSLFFVLGYFIHPSYL